MQVSVDNNTYRQLVEFATSMSYPGLLTKVTRRIEHEYHPGGSAGFLYPSLFLDGL
jgi:hypothetical protein